MTRAICAPATATAQCVRCARYRPTAQAYTWAETLDKRSGQMRAHHKIYREVIDATAARWPDGNCPMRAAE